MTTISVRLQQATKKKNASTVAGLLDLCNEKRRGLRITHPEYRHHQPTLQVCVHVLGICRMSRKSPASNVSEQRGRIDSQELEEQAALKRAPDAI